MRAFVALATALALSVVPATAAADHRPGHPPSGGGGGGGGGGGEVLPTGCTRAANVITCVTISVENTTEDVTRTATEVRERTETQFKETTDTVVESRNSIGTCQVGQSGRRGSQEGILREEFLVTTTEEFLVTFTEEFELTLVDRFLVETTTTLTQTFQGNISPDKLLSTNSVDVIVKTLDSTTKTGERLISSVESDRDKVGETVERAKVGEVFTPTSKCKNNPGQQDNRGSGTVA